MFRQDRPLRPRRGTELAVGIVARISGCPNQKELSIDDQIAHGKAVASEAFQGPKDYRIFRSIGKGERLDREELDEVIEALERNELDLLIIEDIGRLVRGTRAVDIIGIAVDHGTRVLAPNDAIDSWDPNWEEAAIAAARDHVGHNTHTSRRLKQKLMNRFETLGAATARPIYGYIVPVRSTVDQVITYHDWQKDPAATPWIPKGAGLLLESKNASLVADWFNENNLPDGPYCRSKGWTGPRILDFYSNSLLKGKPGRGHKHTVKRFETGRRVSVRNPNGAHFIEVPHLAHLDEVIFDELQEALSARNSKFKRKLVDGVDPRANVPKKRSRFPGQLVTCHYCGRFYGWGANGQGGHLGCSGTKKWKCWNSISFDGLLAVEAMVAAITAELRGLTGFESQFAEIVAAAHQQLHGGDSAARTEFEQQLRRLNKEKANVMAAVRENGSYATLTDELDAIQKQEKELSSKLDRLERRASTKLILPESTGELLERFESEFGRLAIESTEFDILMRRLVPSISVHLVRRIDGGHPLPRAKVTLNLAGIYPDINLVPEFAKLVKREVTLDLFKPTQIDLIRMPALILRNQGMTHQQIDQLEVRPTKTAVSNALALHETMDSAGLVSPYVVLNEPPSDYNKLRRHRNKRYHFEPLEGYHPNSL